MFYILGLVLKIIGIILLVLLGTFIVFVLLALFVPFRYRAVLERNNEKNYVDIKAGWLFRIVYFRIYWAGEKPRICLRILGILFFDSGRPQKLLIQRKKKNKIEIKSETTDKITETVENEQKGQELKEGQTQQGIETEQTKEGRTQQEIVTEQTKEGRTQQEIETEQTKKGQNTYTAQGEQKAESKEQDLSQLSDKVINDTAKMTSNTIKKLEDITQTSETESILSRLWNQLLFLIRRVYQAICSIIMQIKATFQKIKTIFLKIITFFSSIEERIKSFLGFFRKSSAKGMIIRTFFGLEINQKGIKGILNTLKLIGGHTFPYQITGEFVIGTGDPYTTGMILTYLGMFYGFYGKNFNLQVDFEQKRLEGRIKMKGRIRLFHVLLSLFRLWKLKEFKELIKNLKELKEAL